MLVDSAGSDPACPAWLATWFATWFENGGALTPATPLAAAPVPVPLELQAHTDNSAMGSHWPNLEMAAPPNRGSKCLTP
jgi:hypothetical protein